LKGFFPAPIYRLFSGRSGNGGNQISAGAMPGTAIFNRVRTAANRFAGANEGNIAVIFAIASLPILSFVGAAIDYSRANSARSSMQAALDSTALMLGKDLTDGTITTSEINTKAQAYFTALYTNRDAQSVTVNATYTAASGSNPATILVNGSGAVTTDFMKLAGYPNINFGTSSTSTWGTVRMRVAMVLDNTGSMADAGKMPAMKTAAKNLVDQLSALAKTAGDVYVSVVPFAKDVNLGTSYYNQSWIDWSDWDADVANDSWGSCSKSNFTTKSTCESHGKTWTPDHTKWTGCVTDRDQDYDTKNTSPSTANAPTLVPAEEYVQKDSTGNVTNRYCASGSTPYLQPIVPLSYDWSTIKTAIDNMQPTGNTNQGLGLAWGWLTLATGVPFNAPSKDPAYPYKEAIILLSDGLNTQNRWYSNASQIDARQKLLCDNAKAAGITIYTVQVNTGSDPTSGVLQYCASGSDKFYLVTAASQTAAVFNSIYTSLSKLRVSK
jgi:Flp pilus assembly protein TadG